MFIFTHARHLTRFDDPAASLYTRPTEVGPHCRRQHLHDPQRRSCGLAQSRTVRLPISTPFHRSIGLACTCVISLERTPHTMHCYVALTVQHHEAQYGVQHPSDLQNRQSTLSGSMVPSSTARVGGNFRTHFSCIGGSGACSSLSGSDGLQQRQSVYRRFRWRSSDSQ